MSGLRYAIAVLIVLVIASCETPGSSPRLVVITLSSGLEEIPYSPEDLDNPVVRAVVEQCKSQTGEDCGRYIVPIDNRNEFRIGEDSSVYTVVTLGGMAPNRTYEVEWRLFDPDDGLLSKLSLAQHTPSAWHYDNTLDFTFQWEPGGASAWFPGQWRVEIFVNGFKEGERFFHVRGGG
jgi:hypothetical protein